MVLERMPLTPNGKLDRKALPEPEITASAVEAPRTETERVLCAVWAEVLSLPAVGITDNFFRIGGDSILSLRVIARAREQDPGDAAPGVRTPDGGGAWPRWPRRWAATRRCRRRSPIVRWR